jgi:hypothetical protein
MATYPSFDTAPPMAVGAEVTILVDFSAALAAMVAVNGTALTIASVTISTPSPSSGLTVIGQTLNATATGVLLRLSASAVANYAITITPVLSDPDASVDPRTIVMPVVATLG